MAKRAKAKAGVIRDELHVEPHRQIAAARVVLARLDEAAKAVREGRMVDCAVFVDSVGYVTLRVSWCEPCRVPGAREAFLRANRRPRRVKV
jgi:hypothetical protein